MKRLPYILSILSFIVLSGCANKNDLSDIKVNKLDSQKFTQEEYNQILNEFVEAFNESDNHYQKITITEISYAGDDCLQQEIEDWMKNEDLNEKDMEFMLLKLSLDTYQLKDKLNFADGYPDDYYYFIGKKPNGKWEVLRAGLTGNGAYDLQCELKKK